MIAIEDKKKYTYITLVEALSASQFTKIYKFCGQNSNKANEEGEEEDNENDPEISESNETPNAINLHHIFD